MLSFRGSLTAWRNGLTGTSSSTEGCKILHLGRNNPMCLCSWGLTSQKAALQQALAAKAADSTLSCIRKCFGGKLRKVILLYSALLTLHPGTEPCSGLPHRGEMNLLLQIQNRTTKRIPLDLHDYVILTKNLLRWQKGCIVNL